MPSSSSSVPQPYIGRNQVPIRSSSALASPAGKLSKPGMERTTCSKLAAPRRRSCRGEGEGKGLIRG